MKSAKIEVRTSAREEIVIVTRRLEDSLKALSGQDGLCTIFTPHTTTALSINEAADPAVPTDIVRALRAMIPPVRFEHGEGNSDAHLLSTLIGCSITVPVSGGRFLLGQWQGIYFVELDGPRAREIHLYMVEESAR